MKRLAWVLVCAGTLSAQGTRPEPYRINNDVMGESVKMYIHNHPKCTFDPMLRSSEVWPQDGELWLQCAPDDEKLVSGDSDAVYAGVRAWTGDAAFHERDGIVMMELHLPGSDYVRVKAQLISDFGEPLEGTNGEGQLNWSNGVSRIMLEKADKVQLTVFQEKYFREIFKALMEKAKKSEVR